MSESDSDQEPMEQISNTQNLKTCELGEELKDRPFCELIELKDKLGNALSI